MELWRKLGCAAAVLVWILVSFPFLFGLAWSGAHCDPVPQCQRANALHFGSMLVGVAGLAGLTGFLITWTLRTFALRRDDEGASSGFFGLAIIGTIAIAVLVVVGSYAVLDRLAL